MRRHALKIRLDHGPRFDFPNVSGNVNLRERTIDRRDERTVGNPDFLIHERNLTQTDEKSGLCLGSLSLRGGVHPQFAGAAAAAHLGRPVP